jgi:hypothetical protein
MFRFAWRHPAASVSLAARSGTPSVTRGYPAMEMRGSQSWRRKRHVVVALESHGRIGIWQRQDKASGEALCVTYTIARCGSVSQQ